ncbi:hypothetical protein RCS94_00625 [Orbaceae bacterium ac157xtp]
MKNNLTNKKQKTLANSTYEQEAKNLVKAYRQMKKYATDPKNDFGYYESDDFLQDAIETLIAPMLELADKEPQIINELAVKMLKEFEDFVADLDTSSGFWLDFYMGMIQAFFASLAHTSDRTTTKARKIYIQIRKDSFIDFTCLKYNKHLLTTDILNALQAYCLKQNDHENASIVSAILNDIININ